MVRAIVREEWVTCNCEKSNFTTNVNHQRAKLLTACELSDQSIKKSHRLVLAQSRKSGRKVAHAIMYRA